MARKYQSPEDLAVGLGLVYKMEDPVAVSLFLREHSFLVNVLLEAFPKLETYFGAGSSVILRVIEEPDAPSEAELFAMVQTTLPPVEALGRLKSFDKEWWLEVSPQADCKLNFSIEFP